MTIIDTDIIKAIEEKLNKYVDQVEYLDGVYQGICNTDPAAEYGWEPFSIKLDEPK